MDVSYYSRSTEGAEYRELQVGIKGKPHPTQVDGSSTWFHLNAPAPRMPRSLLRCTPLFHLIRLHLEISFLLRGAMNWGPNYYARMAKLGSDPSNPFLTQDLAFQIMRRFIEPISLQTKDKHPLQTIFVILIPFHE